MALRCTYKVIGVGGCGDGRDIPHVLHGWVSGCMLHLQDKNLKQCRCMFEILQQPEINCHDDTAIAKLGRNVVRAGKYSGRRHISTLPVFLKYANNDSTHCSGAENRGEFNQD